MDEIFTKVCECINRVKFTGDINTNSHLIDGIFDSFDLVLFVTEIEKEFSITIEDEEISQENFMVIGSVVNYIKEKSHA